MNQVELLGNIVRDPEIRFTKNGKPWARFTVACSRSFIAQDTGEAREMTDFIPCVAWGKTAEFVGDHMGKGTRAFVQGRISVRSYDKDGQKRYITEVVCDMVANSFSKDTVATVSQSSQPPMNSQAAPAKSFNDMGNDADPNEEIPF